MLRNNKKKQLLRKVGKLNAQLQTERRFHADMEAISHRRALSPKEYKAMTDSRNLIPKLRAEIYRLESKIRSIKE